MDSNICGLLCMDSSNGISDFNTLNESLLGKNIDNSKNKKTF